MMEAEMKMMSDNILTEMRIHHKYVVEVKVVVEVNPLLDFLRCEREGKDWDATL